MVSLDTAQIAPVIHRISELHPGLGDALAQHADGLDFTAILRTAQAANNHAR